jgi:hypothetical protein
MANNKTKYKKQKIIIFERKKMNQSARFYFNLKDNFKNNKTFYS